MQESNRIDPFKTVIDLLSFKPYNINMREWNLGKNDPLCLTIAADARFSHPDYTNDHIWEVRFDGRDPAALSIETTFGLRARRMLVFPSFSYTGKEYTQPAAFFQPPHLRAFSTNYLSFVFSPFEGLQVQSEYWIQDSQTLSGRFTLINTSEQQLTFHFELAALLTPMNDGRSMAESLYDSSPHLAGKSNGLEPVCVLAGRTQPGSGPFPALAQDIELHPGTPRRLTWALAALAAAQDSLKAAQRAVEKKWDAEIARIEIQNSRDWIEISTGSPDWDAGFALAQKIADGLYFPGSEHLPHASFVLTRLPDYGYSPRGDGSDSPLLWNGQTALDAYFLASLILPSKANFLRGILENFLNTGSTPGAVDWKPGLAGQRSYLLAQPLLASLALKINQADPQPVWLEKIYPALLDFIKVWFSPAHDRDQDGYPEWDSPQQSGLEDSPAYAPWSANTENLTINLLESPSLAAMLYRECSSLAQIAAQTHQDADAKWLIQQAQHLKEELEQTWTSRGSAYHYRDFESHSISRSSTLRIVRGDKTIELNQAFPQPQRLMFRITLKENPPQPITIQITGLNPQGELNERLTANLFHWDQHSARCTSRHLYSSITRIEISGLHPKDRCRITCCGSAEEDCSIFLPLWAQIPSAERAQKLIEKNLLAHYFKNHGIPVAPAKIQGDKKIENINISYNHLLGEGLLAYGFRKEAAQLVSRLMDTTSQSLKKYNAFYQFYNAYDGFPLGERNVLQGLAPLGLFLQTLGLRELSPHHAVLEPGNPFPWPVVVRFRATTFTFHQQEILVNFRTGSTITVQGAGLHPISLE